jgi:hypothetical protein
LGGPNGPCLGFVLKKDNILSRNKKSRSSTPQKSSSMPSSTTVSNKQSFSLSRVGKKVLSAGIVCACLGYYILTMADPMGQNWAANTSPFLILGGYALVGLSIIVRDPKPSISLPSAAPASTK